MNTGSSKSVLEDMKGEGEGEGEREGEGESTQFQIHQGIPQIPFDLFLRKTRRRLCFTDAFDNIVYTGGHLSPPKHMLVLFDSSANPLISIHHTHDRSWKAFKGDGCSGELLFRVEQVISAFSEIEFRAFRINEHEEDFALEMRGCRYWRSCTIYQDKSILAQTNLMHKLGFMKIFVRRSKFRITLFPGFSDYNLIAALVLIFLVGK